MRRSIACAIAAVGACFVAAGCTSGDPAGPEAAQIPVVLIDDVAYTARGSIDPAARPVGAAYAEVLRFVDCSRGIWLDAYTHIEDYCPLENGDSNFLPEGTVLYRLEGVAPAAALAVYREYDVEPAIDPEWVELIALTDSNGDGCTPPAGGNLCPPG